MLHKPSRLNSIFKALADRNRRFMVQRLSSGPESVTELASAMPMTMSAVMQHLEVLEASGLVESRKAGRVRTCQLNPDPLAEVADWIAKQQRSLRRFEARS